MLRSREWVGFVLLSFSASAATTSGLDSSYFSSRVYPILEKAGCRGCHSADGVASATRLHFPEANATRDEVERFGRSLAVLTDPTDPAKSLLRNKPTLRVPHTGGKRIAPGSDEDRVLTEWVRRLASLPEAEREAAARNFNRAPVARRQAS